MKFPDRSTEQFIVIAFLLGARPIYIWEGLAGPDSFASSLEDKASHARRQRHVLKLTYPVTFFRKNLVEYEIPRELALPILRH